MGDEVTKKEYLNLAKLVDRMVKEFDEEKKVVHAKLDALTKSCSDTQLQKSLSELKKWAENTFAERKQWFDDEKKFVRDTFAYKQWFDDEKKEVHSQLDQIIKIIGSTKVER
jgi:hypothetical protein